MSMMNDETLKHAVGNLFMYTAELRLRLAKANRAISNGAYGQRLTDLRNEVADLERKLATVGVRP